MRGTWKSEGGEKPENSPAGLREAFERQADEYHQEHPEITIEPVVFDIKWPSGRRAN